MTYRRYRADTDAKWIKPKPISYAKWHHQHRLSDAPRRVCTDARTQVRWVVILSADSASTLLVVTLVPARLDYGGAVVGLRCLVFLVILPNWLQSLYRTPGGDIITVPVTFSYSSPRVLPGPVNRISSIRALYRCIDKTALFLLCKKTSVVWKRCLI